MASPQQIFLDPTTGLDIEFISEFRDDGVEPDFSSKPIEYRLCNTDKFRLIDDAAKGREYRGVISPISKVTLPKAAKRNAGIDTNAVWYSYIHPPKDLAQNIDWEQCAAEQKRHEDISMKVITFSDETNELKNSNSPRKQLHSRSSSPRSSSTVKDSDENSALSSYEHLSIFGGFIYFDKSMNILSINIATLFKTDYVLNLAGPFPTPETVFEGCLASNRTQILPLEIFHEGGLVAVAWIRPNETFQSDPATEAHSTAHGSFVFVRDNETCITYTVEKKKFVDPTGDVEQLSELFSLSGNSLMMLDPKPAFVQNYVKEEDAAAWRRRYRQSKIEKLRSSSMSKSSVRNPEESANSANVKDQICTVDTNESSIPGSLDENSNAFDIVEFLPEEIKKVEFLPKEIKKVDLRSSVIHQACHAKASAMQIRSLIAENDDERNALKEADEFGFTPLHYASRFNAKDHEMIQFLVKQCPESLLKKDQYGRMPLHLACNSRASAEVIKILVDADDYKVSLQSETKYLRLLPIHIATNQRDADIEVLKILIEADEGRTTLRHESIFGRIPLHYAIGCRQSPEIVKLFLEEECVLSDRIDCNSDIFQVYRGFLPIHLACWNRSEEETISLLLEKDERNESISPKVTMDQKYDCFHDNRTISATFDSNSTNDVFYRHEPMALHLAIASGLTDVVHLILQKEIEIQNSPDSSRHCQMIFCKDSKGRTPLALACLSNAEPDILNTLLDLDHKQLSVVEEDDDGFMPIQHLCRHKEAHLESLKMLLSDEKTLYWNHAKQNQSQPLLLAINAGADVENLELLMRPNVISVTGLKGRYVKMLAELVKDHPILQRRLVEKMANKNNFVMLFIRLYTNIIACVVFFFISEDLHENQVNQTEITLLSICTIFFCAREFIQILSEKFEYLLDTANIFEVVNIIYLCMSIVQFSGHRKTIESEAESYGTEKWTLIITCGLLLINTLRSFNASFLSFAKFSSGVYSIFVTLIPFFIACILFLALFIYLYRMLAVYSAEFQANEIGDKCKDGLDICAATTLTHFISGNEEIQSLPEVLFGIFGAVILLNVVIAIISEVWAEAGERAAITFWSSRLDLLSEISIFHHNNTKEDNGKKRFIPLNSQVSWTHDYPFNLVKSRIEYEYPEDYFGEEIAKRIHAAHSLQANLGWIRHDAEINNRNQLEIRMKQTKAVLKWLISLVIQIVTLIAGFLTIGALWPREIREWVLSAGQEKVESLETEKPNNTSAGTSLMCKQG